MKGDTAPAAGRPAIAAVLAAVLAALLAAVLVCASPALAHGAPPPPDDHVHRVLEDHNDDCGGDGVTTRCGGTNDLIALDLIERWDPALKADVLVFRFTLDEGEGGKREIDTTFRRKGATTTLQLATADDATFTGNFDRIASPHSLQDGTRFQLDATVRLATLGAAIGDRLDAFTVTAARDGREGDYMPGGYVTPVGTRIEDPPQGSEPTDYGPVAHEVTGPSRYIGATGPSSAPAGTEVELRLTNLLRRTAQTVTFALEGDAGASASLDPPTVDLPKAAQATTTLRLDGDATGTLRLVATTDLGGRLVKEISVAPAGTPPPPAPPGPDEPRRDSPALTTGPALLVLLAVLAAAWRRP